MTPPADLGGHWLLDDRRMAEMLSCTKPTLRRLVKNGHIPAPRTDCGGLERWHRDEVAAHLRRMWRLDEADKIAKTHQEAAKAALESWGTPAPRRPGGSTRRKV